MGFEISSAKSPLPLHAGLQYQNRGRGCSRAGSCGSCGDGFKKCFLIYFSQGWTPFYGHLCDEETLGLHSFAQDILHNLNPSMKCQAAWPFDGTFHIQACIVRAYDVERGCLISKFEMPACRRKSQGRPSTKNHEGLKGKQFHSGAMQRPSRAH